MARAKTRKTIWKQMTKVLVCQIEEFGFLPVDKRKPSYVFQQAYTMCSFSFGVEQRMNWSSDPLLIGN